MNKLTYVRYQYGGVRIVSLASTRRNPIPPLKARYICRLLYFKTVCGQYSRIDNTTASPGIPLCNNVCKFIHNKASGMHLIRFQWRLRPRNLAIEKP